MRVILLARNIGTVRERQVLPERSRDASRRPAYFAKNCVASSCVCQEARWFEPLRASAAVGMTTNSTHALLAAARAGAGIAVLPKFVARHHDDLIALSENLAEHDVWLITHPEFRRDPKVRATADFVKRIASGPDGLC